MKLALPGHVRSLPRGNILEVSHEREIGLPLDREDKTKKEHSKQQKNQIYGADQSTGRCFGGEYQMRLWPDWVMA